MRILKCCIDTPLSQKKEEVRNYRERGWSNFNASVNSLSEMVFYFGCHWSWPELAPQQDILIR